MKTLDHNKSAENGVMSSSLTSHGEDTVQALYHTMMQLVRMLSVVPL